MDREQTKGPAKRTPDVEDSLDAVGLRCSFGGWWLIYDLQRKAWPSWKVPMGTIVTGTAEREAQWEEARGSRPGLEIWVSVLVLFHAFSPRPPPWSSALTSFTSSQDLKHNVDVQAPPQTKHIRIT